MPIQHAIWKVGDKPEPLKGATIASEQLLEDMIVTSPQILSDEWMLIGRQEQTGMGGRIDLLAIAPDASLVLIELKRKRTPREIVAQAIDYAAWVEQLTTDKIVQIYQRFSNGGSLGEAFQEKFSNELDEDVLNESHQIILVAAELDNATERIINYLNERDIAINVLFFQVFQYGSERLLSRTWLIDPGETQENVITTTKKKGKREPWNGEFYVSFGPLEHRSWKDALQYGYICAGGGTWYSKTLNLLSPDDRIWVKIPKTGFVGVGRVKESAQSVHDFTVETPEGEKSCLEVLEHKDRLLANAEDPDKLEYFVRVDWLDTVTEDKAFNEVGLFGNQNSVCRPNTPLWRHTVDRLKTHFKNWDSVAE